MPRKDAESAREYDRERRNSPEARAVAAERTRLWRLNNSERAKAACRKWYSENRETAAAYSKAWRAANPDKIQANRKKNLVRKNETRKLRNKKNPFKLKMQYVRRMLKRAGCPEAEIQRALQAWKVFNGVCQACGERCSSVWATDHDHLLRTFRGIIGNGCNTSLGQAKDSPKRLRLLADYLERVQNGKS